ncbi:MAG: hypothetical protein QF569_14805 [Candidatus Poribacteria bacterium]|nr:hypothetical protein [Candidatus Poribacteria bacterium]
MSNRTLIHTLAGNVLCICWALTGYSQGFENLENLAKKAKVEADGADHPVTNVNDGDFATRWNAKNDDVDTWIQFRWETAQKINRVHVTEFRSRLRGHTIEYGDSHKQVEELVMTPADANASSNHPGNQKDPVKVPDHVLTFKTVETTVLRYHMTKTVDASSEPSLWEIEIFYDQKSDATALVRPAGLLTKTWAELKTEN